MKRRRWWRMAAQLVVFVLAFVAVIVVALVVTGWRAMGRLPSASRVEQLRKSPQWSGDGFENVEPMHNDLWQALLDVSNASPEARPSSPVAAVRTDPNLLEAAPASGLRVTWFGHSSFLLEIEGTRLLVDPFWGERAGPFAWLGPKRWYVAPIELERLPPLDAVFISHDHYDHLDYSTILRLRERKARFVVPLGVGSHLSYWGIPEAQITELDWWQSTRVGDVEVTATPARHTSGRLFGIGQPRTLWCGFAWVGKSRRVYYTGDTGLFSAIGQIGERLGPFDLTLIESGAYGRSWPDWHLGPEQAVLAHRLVRGQVMLPVHWGLLNLAYHAWTEPVERVLAAAKRLNVTVALPKPGHSLEITPDLQLERWWPNVPGNTAEQDPIVSNGIERTDLH